MYRYTPPGTPKQPTGDIIAVTRRGGETATSDITRPTTNSDTQPASTGIWINPTAPGTTPSTANSDTQLTNTQPTSTDISTPSAASAIPPLATTRPTAKDVRTPTASLESPQHISTASSRLSSSVLDLSSPWTYPNQVSIIIVCSTCSSVWASPSETCLVRH